MKLITYSEAATMLGISVQTLKQALEPDRAALTRAGRRGTNGLLVEEQVRLFMGNNPRTGKKKRLSLTALTPDEQRSWKHYADEVSQGQNQTPDIALVNEVVARQLAPIQEAVTGMARTTETARALRQQADDIEKEGYRKAFSLLRARADTLALAK